LYITERITRDFQSFYGEHTYTIDKGLSMINDPDRLVRTIFCQALIFALYGGINYSNSMYSMLVNEKRLSECGKYDWVGCKVDLRIMDGGEEYLYSRTFEPFSGDARAV